MDGPRATQSKATPHRYFRASSPIARPLPQSLRQTRVSGRLSSGVNTPLALPPNIPTPLHLDPLSSTIAHSRLHLEFESGIGASTQSRSPSRRRVLKQRADYTLRGLCYAAALPVCILAGWKGGKKDLLLCHTKERQREVTSHTKAVGHFSLGFCHQIMYAGSALPGENANQTKQIINHKKKTQKKLSHTQRIRSSDRRFLIRYFRAPLSL